LLTTTPHDDATASPDFAALGIAPDLRAVLARRGLHRAFPIQTATVPPGLAGRDVTGRAPTGSGKTLAFGLPMITRTPRAEPKRPRALVLVPTRELAAQITAELTPLGAVRGLRLHAFYGGVGLEPQIRALRRGVDIAVACPGRLADLVGQRAIDLGDVSLVVVDEADRMADMGFLPVVRRLLDATAADRQTLLFSATLDGDVDVLVRRYQHNPVRHSVDPPANGPVDHELWLVDDKDRTERSADLLARRRPAIVFTRTRHGADRLTRRLERAGVTAAPLHGGRSQGQRDRALAAFRNGEVQALVATDVAARGVHVEGVACVLHYDLPTDAKDYVHRSGRTGRAGAAGLVVSLASPAEHRTAKALLRQAAVDPRLRCGSDLDDHLVLLAPIGRIALPDSRPGDGEEAAVSRAAGRRGPSPAPPAPTRSRGRRPVAAAASEARRDRPVRARQAPQPLDVRPGGASARRDGARGRRPRRAAP
jgi:superfamily II DNA/RNA helicase